MSAAEMPQAAHASASLFLFQIVLDHHDKLVLRMVMKDVQGATCRKLVAMSSMKSFSLVWGALLTQTALDHQGKRAMTSVTSGARPGQNQEWLGMYTVPQVVKIETHYLQNHLQRQYHSGLGGEGSSGGYHDG